MTVALVLRPEPGAAATARRVGARGWRAVISPLFVIEAVGWRPPPMGEHDAVMLTSANAVRRAGPDLARYLRLPAYAVGETTAAAARAAGFSDVRAGAADAAALLASLAADGRRAPLHLSGEDVRDVGLPELRVTRVTVYRATAVEGLSREAQTALRSRAVALLHSPRAAALFAELVDRAGIPHRGTPLAAISAAAAAAAGTGWEACAIAAEPRDEALLAAAASLCERGARDRGGRA